MIDLAKKLVKVEHELNENSETNALGSLCSDFFRSIYTPNKQHSGLFYNLSITAKFIAGFLFISSAKKQDVAGKEIIFGKSGTKYHHQKLMDYLFLTYPGNSYAFDNRYKQCFGAFNFTQRLTLFFKTLGTFFSAYATVKRALKLNDLPINKGRLIHHLVVQLTRYFAVYQFLQQHTALKFILVDFDRGNFAALILAAKKLGIRTATLQHGAINPPYGFNPVVADEIWVWGATWQNALTGLGVAETKVKIVGSTIIGNEGTLSAKSTIKTIGIGPNPVGFEQNYFLWHKLSASLLALGYKVKIKLHPSMKNDKAINDIFGGAEVYEAKALSIGQFFEDIDLLLVSNSGLGYEGIIAGVPVAVVKYVDSIANDHIMIHEGKFPELLADEPALAEKLTGIAANYQEVLAAQRAFVSANIYKQVGQAAEAETIALINKEL